MTEKVKALAQNPTLDLIVKGIVLLLLPWGIWTTDQIYKVSAQSAELGRFMQRGERFTLADAQALEMRMQSERHTQELRLMAILQAFESEFSRDFIRKDEHADHK